MKSKKTKSLVYFAATVLLIFLISIFGFEADRVLAHCDGGRVIGGICVGGSPHMHSLPGPSSPSAPIHSLPRPSSPSAPIRGFLQNTRMLPWASISAEFSEDEYVILRSAYLGADSRIADNWTKIRDCTHKNSQEVSWRLPKSSDPVQVVASVGSKNFDWWLENVTSKFLDRITRNTWPYQKTVDIQKISVPKSSDGTVVLGRAPVDQPATQPGKSDPILITINTVGLIDSIKSHQAKKITPLQLISGWSGVIAHELMHARGPSHTDDANNHSTWDVVYAFGYCVEHNGNWVPPKKESTSLSLVGSDTSGKSFFYNSQ